MNLTEFYLAWGVYLVGALGCLLVWFRMTRGIGYQSLRRILRVEAAVALLMPWTASIEHPSLAPAMLTAFYDALSDGPEAALRAGIPLSCALALGVGLVVLFQLLKPHTKPEAEPKERQDPKFGENT